MKKFTIIAIFCVLLCAFTLVGCVESYNVKAISTDKNGISEVSSNGGIAVKAGKYLYYINGYAGNEVDNVFGDVQKGAIARVEYNTDGTLNMDTNQVIVPKNVYNTVATSGLYIVGDYIYYSSYSIAKDSDGEAKSSNMWIMRTKLDGTKTDVVKEFEDSFSAEYKVVSGHIIYFLEKEIYDIDLSNKRFKEKKIDEDVTSVLFTYYDEGANDFVDTVFYTKASEDDEASNNVVWGYRAGSEKKELIEGKNSYGSSVLYKGGYSITLKEYKYVGSNIRLVYNKSDSGSNAISTGTYGYDFDSNMKFDSTKEIRYTIGSNITSLYFLNEANFLAINGTNLSWYTVSGDVVSEKANLIVASSAPSILSIEESDSKVRVYYVNSSNEIYGIDVLTKTASGYEKSIGGAEALYAGPYDTTWLKYDKVGGDVFFFNDEVLNYTYYITLSELKPHNSDSQVPKLLSLVTDEDQVSLLTSDD